LMDQVYGAAPPVAVSACEYDIPTRRSAEIGPITRTSAALAGSGATSARTMVTDAMARRMVVGIRTMKLLLAASAVWGGGDNVRVRTCQRDDRSTLAVARASSREDCDARRAFVIVPTALAELRTVARCAPRVTAPRACRPASTIARRIRRTPGRGHSRGCAT